MKSQRSQSHHHIFVLSNLTAMHTYMPPMCHGGLREWLVSLLFCPLLLSAQLVNLSLHPTAVPDSFVVRATSTDGSLAAVPNGVFTLRWEVEAGGEVNNGDVQVACGAYTLANYGGVVDIVNHRYFTLVLIGNRPMGQPGCLVTPEGMDIAGVRIRELTGCRHVELVHNAYTGLNNLGYFFSMGGIDMTGQITSDPIAGGECGPCEPPVITAATAEQASTCNGPTDLQMTVEGSTPDYSWYGLYTGVPVCAQPSCIVAAGISGPFLAVSTNACGSDSMVVEVDVDTAACIPPVITTATYSFVATGIKFTTTATGTCLQYMVAAPNGITYTVGSNGNITVPNYAGLGEYLAIVYNACGADTAVFLIEENPQCNPPQINSANASVPGCQFSPLTLTCTATGQGAIGYEWRDPFGTVVGTTANATVPEAMTGDYSVTVSNACGSNWALAPLMLDTAGLGACVPPQILSLNSNSPICAGDTLLLQAEVIADGPCLNYQWSGNNVAQSGTVTTTVPGASVGNYMLTASNACGSVSMSVQAQVITMQYKSTYLCSPEGLHSLDSLAAINLPPGSWFHAGEPHTHYYDPAVDTSGHYFYHHDPSGCAVVRLNVGEYEAAYAGADTSITVCSTDEPFALFDFLGPDAMSGGFWGYGTAAMNGIYDPAFHGSNSYRYRVINGGCNDVAHVVVTEIPATPWYADGDGDGYGDENDEVLACDPPQGYVAEGGDSCPDVYGLMGDACDDGNPATANDTINEECICAGELLTGVTEHGKDGTLLWPNPNRGDMFFVQLPQVTGLAHLTITDATGRAALRRSIPAASTPVQVQLPGGLAAGTYFVGIVTEERTEVRRLVVER